MNDPTDVTQTNNQYKSLDTNPHNPDTSVLCKTSAQHCKATRLELLLQVPERQEYMDIFFI